MTGSHRALPGGPGGAPGGRPSAPTSMDGSDDDPRGGKGVKQITSVAENDRLPDRLPQTLTVLELRCSREQQPWQAESLRLQLECWMLVDLRRGRHP